MTGTPTMPTLPALPFTDIKCESCGMTLRRFSEQMKAGCPKDYDLFKLGPMIEKYHHATHHVGKAPEGMKQEIDRQQSLKDMQKKLKEAIGVEDYEEAAKLRDQIIELEKSK
jgi:protein arginine kinase activator